MAVSGSACRSDDCHWLGAAGCDLIMLTTGFTAGRFGEVGGSIFPGR